MDVEHLVLDADDIAEVQCDMAAHDDVAVVGWRRLVERAGRLGAPVGQYRLVVLAGQADAAYVPALALHVIESAEHQTVFHGAQLGEPVLVHGGERVAFRALGGGPVRAGRTYRIQPRARLRSQGVQAGVCAVDRLLFLVQLR